VRRGRPLADPEAGDRVKTDRRDGASLARLHRAGKLTAVWVPDVGIEAMRDPARSQVLERQAPQSIRGYRSEEELRYLVGTGVSAAAI
jgi:hypothetical protein